nr:isopropylmalate synthase [Clostridium chromiireducens]
MRDDKIEIIDKTIVVLKELYGDKLKSKKPQLRELIKLLYIIGSEYIEITQELYEELSPLPENVKFKMCTNKIIEMKNNYDLYEIFNKESNMNAYGNLRIVGLDDIMFYDYKKIFSNIRTNFGENIEVCIKNTYECATAMTLEWIKLGGKKVITSFAGIGGYAPLEEILGSISFLEKINIRGNHKLFPKVLELFEEIIGSKLNGNMPFIGTDIFNVESGIHVNGIAKNPSTYEPYDPSEIGRERNIIIGKHSGINALEIKLKELNIKYNQNYLKVMLENVRKFSTQKRRGLNNEEIKEIYDKCCI